MTSVPPLEAHLGHRFADPGWLEEALTHRSFAHEAKTPVADNQRLEFLGDAILDACTAALLVERFPELPEGDLSALRGRLVSTDALASLGRRLGLGAHLKLGRGEEAKGGRDKDRLLEDVTEALVGAIFRDAGFETCRRWLAHWMAEPLQRLEQEVALGQLRDPRSRLQELVQQRYKETPRYQDVCTEGPPHEPSYVVAVLVGGREIGRGRGRQKKKAAHQAAAHALEALQGT